MGRSLKLPKFYEWPLREFSNSTKFLTLLKLLGLLLTQMMHMYNGDLITGLIQFSADKIVLEGRLFNP